MVTKQELVHLYGLLEHTQKEYEQRRGAELEDLVPEYEQPELRYVDIARSKDDYKEALMTVADGLTTAMEQDQDDTVSVRDQPYRLETGTSQTD